MEIGEIIKKLRNDKNITQEELAQAIYVSRFAISKWESGRGYPSIDSLKELSKYFSVSLDDLLSKEQLIDMVEKESKANTNRILSIIIGVVDVLHLMLILLPLYSKKINDYYLNVNLINRIDQNGLITRIFFIVFIIEIVIGILEILTAYIEKNNIGRILNIISLFIGVFSVLIIILTNQPYASIFSFVLFAIKYFSFSKRAK